MHNTVRAKTRTVKLGIHIILFILSLPGERLLHRASQKVWALALAEEPQAHLGLMVVARTGSAYRVSPPEGR